MPVSAAEEPLGLTLNFHDLAMGREAGRDSSTELFLLSNRFISFPHFFQSLDPTVTLLQGKNLTVF